MIMITLVGEHHLHRKICPPNIYADKAITEATDD
jgi:hypothetical protein